jgi:hypothetical protein
MVDEYSNWYVMWLRYIIKKKLNKKFLHNLKKND